VGSAGDAYVDLSQLTQPAGDVGPLRVFHDHALGLTRADVRADPLAVLRSSRRLTARALAGVMFETGHPDRNQVERARRRLGAFVKEGLALCVDGQRGGIGGGTPTVYVATCDHEADHAPDRPPVDHGPITAPGTNGVGAAQHRHTRVHADHGAGAITSSSPLRGETHAWD
jgi:hypothetical protein